MAILLTAALNYNSGAATLDLTTATGSAWTVSGGGALNATPFVLPANWGYSAPLLSMTSTGEGYSTWVQGTSQTKFDGFWRADFSFSLPANAANISLTFANLGGDDRYVLALNGSAIAAGANNAQVAGQQVSGSMTLTEGGLNNPYVFTGRDGYLAGTVTSGFNVGGLNTLEAVINNTFSGSTSTPCALYGGDYTYFGLKGTLTYDLVPEPATGSVLVLGGVAMLGALSRKRRQ